MTTVKVYSGVDFFGFQDLHGRLCYLEISKNKTLAIGVYSTGGMILSREQVADLLPYLQKFVDTGEVL